MSLSHAIIATQELRAALEREVHAAQEERTLLRSLNHEAILQRSAAREAFNAHTQQLTARMGAALAQAGKALGLEEVTLDALKACAPVEGAQLADTLAQVRSLSAALSELDALNRHLAERALSVVRAYTTKLVPRPAAYDRRGARATVEQSTWSRRA